MSGVIRDSKRGSHFCSYSFISNTRKPLLVDCDASDNGIGGVLSQAQGEEEKIIGFFSRSLSKPEKNYCVTRKELLALIDAIFPQSRMCQTFGSLSIRHMNEVNEPEIPVHRSRSAQLGYPDKWLPCGSADLVDRTDEGAVAACIDPADAPVLPPPLVEGGNRRKARRDRINSWVRVQHYRRR